MCKGETMSVLINNLKISNFRSCKDTNIALDKFTACIGYNNAGKSNIILALKFLLSGTSRNSPFNVNAFNNKEPICVEAQLSEINDVHLQLLEETHAKKISEYLDSGTLKIKRESAETDFSKYEFKVFDFENSEWKKLPTGFENSVVRLFPNLIHILAMSDAGEDSTKSKSSTTIGQLLELISEEIKIINEEKFSQSLNVLKNLLSCDSKERIKGLHDTDKEINDILNIYFPDISVKIDFPIPDISDIFKTGTLKIFDNHLHIRDFSQFGHGTQRSIQMALIQYLAELTQLGEKTRRSNTFICIDEPELYLHPYAISCVRETLQTLVKKGYQVLITTHSPMILSAESSMDAVQIYKDSNLGTKARYTVNQSIASNPRAAQIQDIFKYNNSAVIFFNEFVLLGEGKTEIRLLPNIFLQVKKSHFHSLKVGIIETSGKSNLFPMREVINNLGIPTLIVADLDFVADCIKLDNLIEIKLIDNLINVISQLNTKHSLGLDEKLIKQDSLTNIGAKLFKKLCEHEEFTLSLEPIREKLKEQNIFIWGKGDIEAITELSSKKESEWNEFNQILSSSETGIESLKNYESILEFCNWIDKKIQKEEITDKKAEEQAT